MTSRSEGQERPARELEHGEARPPAPDSDRAEGSAADRPDGPAADRAHGPAADRPDRPAAVDAAPAPREHSSDPFEGAPTRLHPAVLVVWSGRSLFSLVVVLLVAGLMGLVALGAFVALALGIVLRYLRFRWWLEPDAVIIHEGLLFRKRRVIRRDRIQTVDLERGILHRLLGVVEVRIEAIGGAGTQGKLAAVSRARGERLRRVLLAREAEARGDAEARSPGEPGEGAVWEVGVADGAHVPPPRDAPERVLAQVTPESLVVAGVTGGRVGVAAAIVGFFFQTVPEAWWTETVGRIVQQAPDPTTVVGLRVILVFVVFALLGGFFLSVVATVFAHWDFTLTAGRETLGVRRGLFTEHRDTVPFRRIQAVRIEENLVRRVIGRASLRAVVAGRAGARNDEGTNLLLPIGTTGEVYRLAREAVGLGGEGKLALNRMPPRARRRRMVRAVLGGLVLAGAAELVGAFAFGGAPRFLGEVVFAAYLPLGLLLAEGAYRALGWADLDTHLVVREGLFNRRTTVVPVDRLQALETTQNPFQRIAGLATLHLQVARPLMGPTPRALDLAGAPAGDWRERLAGRAAGGSGLGPGRVPVTGPTS